MKPDYRCIYDNRMYSVSSIDILHETINLCGAEIINFNEGILIQYTGINDSRGKKIYEGSILEFNYQGRQRVKCFIEYSTQYAEFVTRCEELYFDQEPLGDILEHNCTDIKVIGHINIKNDRHDNPEGSDANSFRSLDIDISKIITRAKQLNTEIEKLGPEVSAEIYDMFKSFIDISGELFKEIKSKNEHIENLRKANADLQLTLDMVTGGGTGKKYRT